MYEIVNEPNLTIAFDMDVELSEFGVFGVYIKRGYNICSGYIDPSDRCYYLYYLQLQM